LQGIGGLSALLLAFLLRKENKRLDRMEGEDSELTEKDLFKLRRRRRLRVLISLLRECCRRDIGTSFEGV